MALETTYSDFRARLAEHWDRLNSERSTMIVKRRGKDDLAVLPADELASLQETLHLLSSPRNAARIFEAINDLDQGRGVTVTAEALTEAVEAADPARLTEGA